MREALKKRLKRISIIAQANAIIKAPLQERKARQELVYYRAEAKRKGIKCPEVESLNGALRHRLAERGALRRPKRKGNLHIFLAYYVSNWETILPKALEPFGTVTAFNWLAHGFDDRRPDWLEQRDRMNAAMLEAFHTANRKEPIDAVVGYLSGNNSAPEMVEEMARSGAVVFNFCWDDKLSFRGKKRWGRYIGPAAIARAVDLNLTNAADCTIKYAVHGGLAMFWPEAAHPEVYRPYTIPFEFDVSFIGGCYGWRLSFMRRLSRVGVKVECFGPGWSNGPLTTEEMVKLYSRSRINLGFAGVGYSWKLMCLKGRDFEVPMSGGLYLTQDNPELSLVYNVGEEIWTYKDERDCAEKIRYLLRHPQHAEKIRKAGRERAQKGHTWEKRFEDIFRLAGLLEQ